MEFINNDFSNGKLYVFVPFELKEEAKNLKCMAGFDFDRKIWYVNNTITPAKLKQLIELEKVVIYKNSFTAKIIVYKYYISNLEDKNEPDFKNDRNIMKLSKMLTNEEVLELLKAAQPEPKVSSVKDFF